MGFFSRVKDAAGKVAQVADKWWGKEEPAQPTPPKPEPRPKKQPKAKKPSKVAKVFRRKSKQEPTKPAPQSEATKPAPAVAREMLFTKFHDMFWLQGKWDAATTSKQINRMTDAQVYAALDMSENDIDSAVRADPRSDGKWADPDDPNANILWYHGRGAKVS